MPTQRSLTRRLCLGAAALLAVAVPGCGGGDEAPAPSGSAAAPASTAAAPASTGDAPQPSESAEAYAERWAAALRDRDCETLIDVYGYVPDQAPKACREVSATLRGIEIVEVEQYGPAALIRFRAPDSDIAAIREDAVQPAVALAETDGRFTDAGSQAGVTSFLAESFGGPPRLEEQTQEVVERYVDIIRDRDCDALFELELTPEGGTKEDQCAAAFEGSMGPALQEAPDVTPERLGGSGGWTFYGLRAGERYFVIPTLIDSNDNDDIDVVGYYRVEGPPA